MNNKLLAGIVVIVVVIAAVAVWQFLPTAPAPESIKIGLVAPYQIPVGQDPHEFTILRDRYT